MDVLEAVNKYGSMREIEATRAQANEALKQTLREKDEAQAKLAPAREAVDELNRRIGAIQEKHRTSRTLMNVASLLENPTTANLEPQEFMVLALALLNTLKQYAYVHRGSLGSWNAWVNPDVNSAATNLNNIIVGKLS
jgi:Tfp pilus assembly protein PilO